MKEYFFAVAVPILAAILGAVFLPLLETLRRSLEPTYDDKQSVLGKYNCQWFEDFKDGEKLYASDIVEISKIKGSMITAFGLDQRFKYSLFGNISRGGVLAFFYIILNKPMSLTGSLTIVINPSGSTLEGRWCGYVTEGRLACGRVVWTRIPEVGMK